MTTEQKNQQKLIDANTKAQKELSDQEFRKRARTSALQDAKHIERDASPEIVLKTADKLYQWLIKILK